MKREYIDRIDQACYLDYYLSANDGARVYIPSRMHPPKEATDSYREMCDRYIIDSDPQDPDVTNVDVLDTAVEVNADAIVLEDVYLDYHGTVERVREGMETARSHAFDGDVIAPLQPPHVDCYKELGEPNKVAIGGLKDADAMEKLHATKELRSYAGPETYIHGLGFGATPEIVQAVRDNPDLLDSIDAQTPFAAARKNEIWAGDERMSTAAAHSQGILLEKCRRMSDLADDPNQSETTKTTLTQYHA